MKKAIIFTIYLALLLLINPGSTNAQGGSKESLRNRALRANKDHFKKIAVYGMSGHFSWQDVELVELFKKPLIIKDTSNSKYINDTLYDGFYFQPNRSGYLYWAFQGKVGGNGWFEGWYMIELTDSTSKNFFSTYDYTDGKRYYLQQSALPLQAYKEYLIWFNRNDPKLPSKTLPLYLYILPSNNIPLKTFFGIDQQAQNNPVSSPTSSPTSSTSSTFYKSNKQQIYHWDPKGGPAEVGGWEYYSEATGNYLFEIKGDNSAIILSGGGGDAATYTIESQSRSSIHDPGSIFYRLSRGNETLEIYIDANKTELTFQKVNSWKKTYQLVK